MSISRVAFICSFHAYLWQPWHARNLILAFEALILRICPSSFPLPEHRLFIDIECENSWQSASIKAIRAKRDGFLSWSFKKLNDVIAADRTQTPCLRKSSYPSWFHRLTAPAQSPDLIPVENLWSVGEKAIPKMRNTLELKQQLRKWTDSGKG